MTARPTTLEWIARAVGTGARVRSLRKLVGGITSDVRAVNVVDGPGRTHRLVLRRWGKRDPSRGAERVRREAHVLQAVSAAGLPAPDVVATDPSGEHNDGRPALLMTRVPGHVHLTPRDPDDWIAQTARMLPRIHALDIDVPGWKPWVPPNELKTPEWPQDAARWQRAVQVVRAPRPAYHPRFVHADYQHYNLLWSRERLTGIVDWVFAARGHPDIDVGHCRLNLTVLFSASTAERFLHAYEAEAGRRVDPVWDLAELLAYGPDWKRFIPVQAGRRAVVDVDGMDARVEELVAVTLDRV